MSTILKVALITVLIVLLVGESSQQTMSTCPHLIGSLSKLSTISKWNVEDSQLEINGHVLVDQSPNVKLKSIVVKSGGALIFDDTNLKLLVEWIRVDSGASFVMGSSNCPINNKITISFIGNRTSENIIGSDPFDSTVCGYKGIAFMSGSTVQIHGKTPDTCWTRLEGTVKKGDSVLRFIDPIYNSAKDSWKVGDRIVIASTDFLPIVDTRTLPFYDGLGWMGGTAYPNQNEERMISEIIDSHSIRLDRPLNYTHWGKDHMKAEVGLLTRRILFEGEQSTSLDRFGGHIMIRLVEKIEIDGIELIRMGQKGLMGRYAIHFHLLDKKALSNPSSFYIKNSAIHDGFQRCVVIHDTSYVTIENNVCFNNIGHQFFLEDGSEFGNQFIYNLGIDPIPVANNDPNQIIPTDSDVSVFWITNPNNTWIGNSAVGSKFPFWFLMPLKPTGLSQAKYANDPNVNPRSEPLGIFRDNIMHGGHIGLNIDNMLTPDGKTEAALYKPKRGKVEISALFENLIIYKNRRYGFWSEGGPIIVRNSVLSDNRIAVGMPPGPTLVQNCVIIGESDNVGDVNSLRLNVDGGGRSRPLENSQSDQLIKGFETYDNGGPQYLRNITFVNFVTDQYKKSGALGVLDNGPFKHETRNRYHDMKFINSNEFIILTHNADNNFGSATLITDNSISNLPHNNRGNSWIVSNASLVTFKECIDKYEWQAVSCPPFAEGYSQLSVINMITGTQDTTGSNGVNYPDLSDPKKVVPRMYLIDMTRNRKISVNGALIQRSSTLSEMILDNNVINRGFYAVRWVFNVPTPSTLRLSYSSSSLYDWIVVAVQYPRGTTFKITNSRYSRAPIELKPTNNLESLMKSNMVYYFDENSEHLFIKMQNQPDWGYYHSQFENFSNLLSDNSNTVINATCPNGRCLPSSFNLPPNHEKLLKTYNKEERYSGILQTCQQEKVSPVQSNQMGSGVTFAFVSPDLQSIEVSVYHDLASIVTKVELGIGAVGEERRLIKLPYDVSPFSLSRIYYEMNYYDYVSLLKGEMFVKVSTTLNPNGHLRAQLYCNNGGLCRLPQTISKPIDNRCNNPILKSSDVINVFTDNDETKNMWTPISGTHVSDVQAPILDRTYNKSVICGQNSLLMGVQRGGLIFSRQGDVTKFGIDISIFKYFEFLIKTMNELPMVLSLCFNYQNGSPTNRVESPCTKLTSEYVDTYKIDSSTISRVRFPMERVGFPAHVIPQVNITSIILRIAPEYSQFGFYTLLFDNIRFVKEIDSTSEALEVPIQESEIKIYEKNNKVCGIEMHDPDHDPFNMRFSSPIEPSPSVEESSTRPENSQRVSLSSHDSFLLEPLLVLIFCFAFII